MKPFSASSPVTASSTELAWRILNLVNLFRLLVPLVLGSVFVLLNPRQVGQAHSAMFAGVAVAYFLFAVVAISSIRTRWPGLEVQALAQVLIDILAVTLIAYSSGSANAALAALLVLPIGASSLIVRQRLGLGLAAIAVIALLAERIVAMYAGFGDRGDLTSTGVVGALIFVVTLGVAPLANRLRE